MQIAAATRLLQAGIHAVLQDNILVTGVTTQVAAKAVPSS
jgi:hypothetical protein